MADQEFPSHLAGFVVGAFAAGYGVSSLKQYVTGRMTPTKTAEEESNVLPLASSRKRKADSDITSLPPTKKGKTHLVNRSDLANGSNSSLGLDAPPPPILVNTSSVSVQGIVNRTANVIDPRLTHYAQARSPSGEGISVHELEDQVDCDGPRAALTCRDEKGVMSAGLPTIENKLSEEYQDSDHTIIGDDFEDYNAGAVEFKDQNGDEEQTEGQDKEIDDTNNLSEGHESGNHDNDEDDLMDRDEEQHDSQRHEEDDDEFEDGREGYGDTNGKTTMIDSSRQNELLDVNISILQRRSSGWEIIVKNQQSSVVRCVEGESEGVCRSIKLRVTIPGLRQTQS